MLRLRFKKKNDGTAVITAVRPDGTSTYHIHDFSHYVVESYFGFSRGFYGLLAEGWNIDDFETGARGPIPADAALPERLAGAVSMNVATPHRYSASDINFTVGQDAVTESQLSEMERTLANLCSQWRALPPGETLELEIELGVISSQSCQPGSPRV